MSGVSRAEEEGEGGEVGWGWGDVLCDEIVGLLRRALQPCVALLELLYLCAARWCHTAVMLGFVELRLQADCADWGLLNTPVKGGMSRGPSPAARRLNRRLACACWIFDSIGAQCAEPEVAQHRVVGFKVELAALLAGPVAESDDETRGVLGIDRGDGGGGDSDGGNSDGGSGSGDGDSKKRSTVPLSRR